MVACSGIWRAVHELVAQIACFPDTGISLGALHESTSLPPGTSLEAAQLLACKTQSVLRLSFCQTLDVPMKGQLSLPCAMLLGHPTNAGGSLTHPSSPWVFVHAGTACSRAVGKDVIWEIEKRRRLMAASERQQQTGSSSQAGREQGWNWGCCFCSEFPQSLELQEGSCGKMIHAWMSLFNPAGS